MRKLLLMGAAVLGASVVVSTVPALAAGPVAGPSMGPGSPPPFLAGHFSSQGGPPAAGPYTPTPGTMVIHLNGRVQSWLSLAGSPADNPGAYTYTDSSGKSVSVPAGNKNEPYDFHGFMRLYPGMDAEAANGLRYGALIEIRQDFGSVAASSGSTGASGQSTHEYLYVRRAMIYFGTDQLGLVRFGQDDGPFSQLDGGVTTFQFNDGAWNGDGPSGITGATPTWPFWSGIGNEYTISKIVYLSPQFSGFDFAVSYAPNNSANTGGATCPNHAAGTGCSTLETSTVSSDAARAKDMFELMGRYRAKVNDVGIYAIAGYAGSGHVGAASPATAKYDGFSVGDVGLVLSYAGFSFGGNFMVGDFNGQVALKPKGGVHGLAWLVGATYKTGPFNFGASYFNYQDQGDPGLVGVSQRYNSGLAVSGQYQVAPGFRLIASYVYGWVHQGGVVMQPDGSDSAWSQGFILEGKVYW